MSQSIARVLEPTAWKLLETVTPLGVENARTALDDIDADTRAAILTQVELRHLGREKFGDFAQSLLLTRDGLEQATRLSVGARHAQRFRDGGCTVVADLGCGIGADALAIAGLGVGVRAWDIDEDAVAATTVNLRFFPNCAVTLGDVTKLSMPELASQGIDGVFADPARRTGSAHGARRITSPDRWSPSLSHVLQWRNHGAPADKLGVKVAPGIPYAAIPSDMHAQWISVDKTVVEASLWTPALAPEGPGRSAVIIRKDRTVTLRSDIDPAGGAPAVEIAPLRRYLWEPDGAIIRAGLLSEFARRTGAAGIAPSIAYLTSETPVPEEWGPAISEFEILTTTSLKSGKIATALRDLSATDIQVKKRGADISPDTLRRSLLKACRIRRASGENPITVFATRVGEKHRAIIAQRVPLP
ncbi:MAG: class I SAM-dependent methyltransferase [Actinomycetaceae bacterium]|nr:class I SAM-dependent methyltransferase [Actinomycetaceae bacterium]